MAGFVCGRTLPGGTYLALNLFHHVNWGHLIKVVSARFLHSQVTFSPFVIKKEIL